LSGARASWLAAACAVALAAVGGTPAAAAVPASDPSGCLTVHAGPDIGPGSTPGYFRLAAAAGKVRHVKIVVANPNPYVCHVVLDAAYGKTALNSGDTYPRARSGRCVRTSCWLLGFPRGVTVPANARVVVRFAVRIPSGTPAGEYLAGVLVRPGSVPQRSVRRPGVGAVVLTSVGIGVAIRVPGPLRPLITIPQVTLVVKGGTPLLEITEHDGGNTWEHPAGGAIISNGAGARASRLGVQSNTVLPTDSATLTLPVAGVSKGTHPTEVILYYDHDRRKAIWRGTVTYPLSQAASAQGRTVVVTSTTPTWVIALASVLGAATVVLATLLLIFLRRRRKQDAAPAAAPAPEPEPEPSASGTRESG